LFSGQPGRVQFREWVESKAHPIAPPKQAAVPGQLQSVFAHSPKLRAFELRTRTNFQAKLHANH